MVAVNAEGYYRASAISNAQFWNILAVDKNSIVAAATSTVGLASMHKGRVGDSPIIGGGTYALYPIAPFPAPERAPLFIKGVLAH